MSETTSDTISSETESVTTNVEILMREETVETGPESPRAQTEDDSLRTEAESTERDVSGSSASTAIVRSTTPIAGDNINTIPTSNIHNSDVVSTELSTPLRENQSSGQPSAEDNVRVHQFEVLKEYVGLLIGKEGKNVMQMHSQTNAVMRFQAHFDRKKHETHQICTVKGTPQEIDRCLKKLRRKFSKKYFPRLQFEAVTPPRLQMGASSVLPVQPAVLTLPDNGSIKVLVVANQSPFKFSVQWQDHPAFASLEIMSSELAQIYGRNFDYIPQLPAPCAGGVYCAVEIEGSWRRVVTGQSFYQSDEIEVLLVDHGGLAIVPRERLRQLRADLIPFPMQAIRVMLANVEPIDGMEHWDEVASREFEQLCSGKMLTCKLVGHSTVGRIPMVELYEELEDADGVKHSIRYDQLLVEKGFARTADPSKMIRVAPKSPLGTEGVAPVSPLGTKEKAPESPLGTEGVAPESPLGTEEKAPESPLGTEEKTPESPLGTEGVAPESPLGTEGVAPESPLGTEGVAPESPLGTEKKAPESPLGTEENAPESPLGTEGVAPESPLGTEEKAPESPLGTEGVAPVSPLGTKEKAPELPLGTEEKAPELPRKTEEVAPESPLGTEEKAPESPKKTEEVAPELPLGTEEKAPESPLGTEREALKLPMETEEVASSQ